jgi:rubrerythrin
MTNFKSVDEILDFAIKNEQEAQEFYADLAKKTTKSGMSELFRSFVDEEKSHEEKLTKIKTDKSMLPSEEKVTDLKISDYLVPSQPSGDMSYQDALILAMKKEKAAFKMYTNLSQRTEGEIKNLFAMLAQEEAKHKLFFETEYDENVLAEN